ncbi:MAG: hypothetical protein JRJ03_09525 [Deltaproteobacteria bacterium]|nr:hypothetical protein [Deltaproteobacteria bacterium]
MSIKELARELYRLQKEVEDLERELVSVPAEKRGDIGQRLSKARAKRDRMRKILEDKKGKPPYRRLA